MFFRNRNSILINYAQACAILFFVLCLIHVTESVRVECKTSNTVYVKKCDIGTATRFSSITLLEQDEGSYCVQNINFDLVLNGTESYILVMFGCFGVFDVTTPASVTLGSWGPCSVTCGAGTRTRARSCSTGRDEDCKALPDWSSATTEEACSLAVCVDVTTPTGPPLCGFSPKGYRVFGGQDAKACEFPWMVMVHKSGTPRRCGGTILDNTHILTAAHCLNIFDYRMLRSLNDEPDTLMVYIGSSFMPLTEEDNPDTIQGLIQHTVANVDIHEGYDPFHQENDIAVLTLSEPIEYNQCAVPICMIDSDMSVYDATNCRTMGWGRTEEDDNGTNQLKWTDLDIIPEKLCRYYYGASYFSKNFCAGGNGHDSCDGDSGGPLICKGPFDRYYQYGIVSRGLETKCGLYGGMYTNLQNYTQWLAQRI